MAENAITDCTCPIAGMCDRHGIKKPEGWFKLCQSNQGYVDLWDEGKGPGQRKDIKGETKRPVRIPPSIAWKILHLYAVLNSLSWSPELAKKWYCRRFLPKVPNFGCSCKAHWKTLTKRHPPDFSSPKAFFEWTVARHNDVSTQHSKKPTITLSEAYAIYWP